MIEPMIDAISTSLHIQRGERERGACRTLTMACRTLTMACRTLTMACRERGERERDGEREREGERERGREGRGDAHL